MTWSNSMVNAADIQSWHWICVYNCKQPVKFPRTQRPDMCYCHFTTRHRDGSLCSLDVQRHPSPVLLGLQRLLVFSLLDVGCWFFGCWVLAVGCWLVVAGWWCSPPPHSGFPRGVVKKLLGILCWDNFLTVFNDLVWFWDGLGMVLGGFVRWFFVL